MHQEVKTSSALGVLELPELLELIILELPIVDIMATARVNRRWSDIIEASTKIQQKLFLRPSAATVKPAECAPRHRFGPCYPKHITINPVLKSNILGWSNAGEARMRLGPTVVTGSRSERTVSGLSHAVLRPEASWREMFATSPPCTELEVELQQVSNEGADSDETTRCLTLCAEKGLKLGMLEDAATGMNAGWRTTAANRDAEVSNYFKFHMPHGGEAEKDESVEPKPA